MDGQDGQHRGSSRPGAQGFRREVPEAVAVLVRQLRDRDRRTWQAVAAELERRAIPNADGVVHWTVGSVRKLKARAPIDEPEVLLPKEQMLAKELEYLRQQLAECEQARNPSTTILPEPSNQAGGKFPCGQRLIQSGTRKTIPCLESFATSKERLQHLHEVDHRLVAR